MIGLGCVTFGREIGPAASFELLDHATERLLRNEQPASCDREVQFLCDSHEVAQLPQLRAHVPKY